MIYLNSTDSFVNFPRTNKTEYREYNLKLTNQTTQTEVVAKHLQNTSNNNSFYILSVLDIVKSLDNGQYDYYILEPDTNSIIESGVIQFGEYQIQNTMAYTNSVKINSYNPYFPPTPKPKKVLDVSLNGDYDVEDYDVCSVDVFVPETEVISKTYDDNGKYMIKPSSSDKVMSEVDVTVNVPKRKEEQVKSITINESGDYTVTPDEGKVLSEVDITVPTIKETYDFNEIGYTNDLIDFNSDIANSKLVYDRFNGKEVQMTSSLFENYLNSINANLVFCPNMSWSYKGMKNYVFETRLLGLFGTDPAKTIIACPIDTFNYNTQYLFNGCSALTYLPDTMYFGYNDYSNTRDLAYTFYNCQSLKQIPNIIFDTTLPFHLDNTFNECNNIENYPEWLDFSNMYMYSNLEKTFCNCKKMKFRTHTVIEIKDDVYLRSYNGNLNSFMYGCKSIDNNFEIIIHRKTSTDVIQANAMLAYTSNLKKCPKIKVLCDDMTETVAARCAEFGINPDDLDINIQTSGAQFPELFNYSGIATIGDCFLDYITGSDYGLFVNCGSLKSIGKLVLGSINSDREWYAMFSSCYALEDIGGLCDLGKSVTNSSNANVCGLSDCSKLTSQSVDNIADTLYDMTGKDFSPTMKFHKTVYNNMTDEQKAKFAAKNWTVIGS